MGSLGCPSPTPTSLSWGVPGAWGSRGAPGSCLGRGRPFHRHQPRYGSVLQLLLSWHGSSGAGWRGTAARAGVPPPRHVAPSWETHPTGRLRQFLLLRSCCSPTAESNSFFVLFFFLKVHAEEKVDFHRLCKAKVGLCLREAGKHWHGNAHDTVTQLTALSPPAAALPPHPRKEKRSGCASQAGHLLQPGFCLKFAATLKGTRVLTQTRFSSSPSPRAVMYETRFVIPQTRR